ncbi:TFIIB-type zinc ribbon-containing protein [Leptospira fainei]|uniref:hypothetical protein n=1 Tax=Leptospira fainei TaxID=48782 RepID=UPI0018DE592E|nr:hypothetical protein [Leptospira fainei]
MAFGTFRFVTRLAKASLVPSPCGLAKRRQASAVICHAAPLIIAPAVRGRLEFAIGKELMNVFVSRPNWIPKDYSVGLENFLRFLESQSLKCRTIGTTDFPAKSPLDEVIRVMKECKGAIILGYPQIILSKGKVKSKNVSELKFATEWNHIEASLAYSLDLPILVLHDLNVSRGIFDRGTLNRFIYELDLKEKDWIFKEEIVGAFSTWKKELDNRPNSINDSKHHRLSDFIEESGILFRVKNGKIERNAYCPECKLPMTVFPPGSNEILFCSKCGFQAPFRPKEIEEVIDRIKL